MGYPMYSIIKHKFVIVNFLRPTNRNERSQLFLYILISGYERLKRACVYTTLLLSIILSKLAKRCEKIRLCIFKLGRLQSENWKTGKKCLLNNPLVVVKMANLIMKIYSKCRKVDLSFGPLSEQQNKKLKRRTFFVEAIRLVILIIITEFSGLNSIWINNPNILSRYLIFLF